MAIFTKNPYCKKYLLTHPWEIFAHLGRDIKCAWQRANKGYCFRDLWDIDIWFLRIIPKMLEDFKSNLTGYPVDMTEDDWNKYLNDMIFYFKESNEETCSKKNMIEYNCDFNFIKKDDNFSELKITYPTKEDELKAEQHTLMETNLEEYRKKCKDKAFKMFIERFDSLWD